MPHTGGTGGLDSKREEFAKYEEWRATVKKQQNRGVDLQKLFKEERKNTPTIKATTRERNLNPAEPEQALIKSEMEVADPLVCPILNYIPKLDEKHRNDSRLFFSSTIFLPVLAQLSRITRTELITSK